MNIVHVEDVAGGVLLALDKGEPGRPYNLGGEITTMRGLMETLADVAGKKRPKRAMPTGMLRAIAPAGPLVGKLMGQPPNMRELVSFAVGVTFWANHDRAIGELGYAPRDLGTGLRDMLAAQGRL